MLEPKPKNVYISVFRCERVKDANDLLVNYIFGSSASRADMGTYTVIGCLWKAKSIDILYQKFEPPLLLGP